MRCRAVKPRVERAGDGRPVVTLVMGNAAGSIPVFEELAWTEMPPGMARDLGISLIEAAAEAERLK